MSDTNINNMNIKQLRNAVQLLRDEIAIMKRKYEDILYNLDTDNFSSRFVKEQGDMRTAIEVTAEGIKTKVSKEELDKYSTIEQTAESIQSVVSKTAELDKAIEIESLEKLKANGDKENIYVIREKTTNSDGKSVVKSETYYYFNDITNQWEVLSGDSIYTMFEQTSEGFNLKGNVKIDGSTVITENLTLSGIVTWNMDNSPVKTQYSVNGSSNWHDTYTNGDMYMRMTFNGGKNWSTATKVVGSDGVVEYSKVNSILENNYGIESTAIGSASIASPQIYAADIYSPNIYGQHLILVAQNQSDSLIYNNLQLTPTSMSLVNSSNKNEKEKFAIDLGDDSDNSYVLMRLGAGVNNKHNNSLILEKYSDYIKIGSNTQSHGFVGLDITPSTGKMNFYGATVGGTAKFA